MGEESKSGNEEQCASYFHNEMIRQRLCPVNDSIDKNNCLSYAKVREDCSFDSRASSSRLRQGFGGQAVCNFAIILFLKLLLIFITRASSSVG